MSQVQKIPNLPTSIAPTQSVNVPFARNDSSTVGCNLEAELAALNLEMERIQKQYIEIVKIHKEAQLLAFSEEWLYQKNLRDTQKASHISSPFLSPFQSPAVKTQRRYNDAFTHPFNNKSPSDALLESFPSLNPANPSSGQSHLNQEHFEPVKHTCRQSSQMFPKFLDSFSNLNIKNVRKILPRMGIKGDSNGQNFVCDESINNGFTETIMKNASTNELNGILPGLEPTFSEEFYRNNYFEKPENLYCALQDQELRTHYETLQFKMKDDNIHNLRNINNEIYNNENINFYHVLETSENNSNLGQKNINGHNYKRVFKNGDCRRIYERRTSHSDLEHPESLDNKIFVKEWNSDGDKEEREPEESEKPEHKRKSRNSNKMCVKKYLNHKKRQQAGGFKEVFVDGFVEEGLNYPIDVMYTNHQHLLHTINLQQSLLQQQLRLPFLGLCRLCYSKSLV